MDTSKVTEKMPTKNQTAVERKSDRELIVTRTVNGPARLVFEAWTKPELFKQWWVPKSAPCNWVSCDMDVRTGGSYRLVFTFAHDPTQAVAVFGKYREVTPHSRVVWTNDENGEANAHISTVTFEERGNKTIVVLHELHPSKEALDAALASGSYEGMPETFDQLEDFIAARRRD